MNVWRLPLFEAAALVVSVVTLAIVAGLVSLRQRARSGIARGFASAAIVVALLAGSPALLMLLTEPAIAAAQKSGLFIHPFRFLGWCSSLFAVVLLVASRYLFPVRDSSSKAVRWRSGFIASAVAFAILNLANWCSPGWCARFGFPFAYSTWSDAIVVFNGKTENGRFSAIAIAGNLLIFALAAGLLSMMYRRDQQ